MDLAIFTIRLSNPPPPSLMVKVIWAIFSIIYYFLIKVYFS